MINPYVCKIDGDLSRADAVVLVQLSRGKKVVEFGVGASTIILSQSAKQVISYETEEAWIEKTKPKVGSNVEFRLITKDREKVTGLGEECDVLFDDGHSVLRDVFILEFWKYVKEYAILHDSRMTYAGNVLKRMIDAFTIKNPKADEEGFDINKGNPGLPDNPYMGSLEKIYWNYLESNMVILKKRNCTLLYENWKVTEKEQI